MWPCRITINVLLLVHLTFADPSPNPEPAGLQHLSPTSPQNLEKVVTAIEERLRSLDSIYALRFNPPPRWELNMETHSRKLEGLESKLARLETVLELRVDKITESLSSKALKEELSKEQLGRKIDVIYERLNHRMSFMESRIESNINKFQSSLETTLTRTNNQLEHLEKASNDVENDILELSTAAEESKSILQSLNSSVRTTWNDSCDQNERIENLSNYTQQVFLLCQETSLRSRNGEEMSRKSLDLVNATRRELQDGVKAVKASANRRITCPSLPEETLDYLVEKTDTMQRQNDGNYQKLNRTLELLRMRQDLYQDSCHRLQLKEPQIENRIAEILEKIWDSLENRTYTTERNYETLLEVLKGHHSQVVRTVGQTTNTVLRLSQQISSDFKSLYTNHPATDKIDQIIVSLQELQEEFQELNDTILEAQHLTPSQSQFLLNNTATILRTIQNLNENMTTILDKLSDYYRNIADPYEPESDVSAKILQIFNMTEADLLSANDRAFANGKEQRKVHDTGNNVKVEIDTNENMNGTVVLDEAKKDQSDRSEVGTNLNRNGTVVQDQAKKDQNNRSEVRKNVNMNGTVVQDEAKVESRASP